MRKKMILLVATLVMTGGIFTLTKQVQAESSLVRLQNMSQTLESLGEPTDFSVTNAISPYPSIDTMLPNVPIPPADGLQDIEGFETYADEVDAYIQATQKYIDGAANDVNDILNKRFESTKTLGHISDTYNSFMHKEEKNIIRSMQALKPEEREACIKAQQALNNRLANSANENNGGENNADDLHDYIESLWNLIHG